jgi:O-antigen/teichoic acid export membrane protein
MANVREPTIYFAMLFSLWKSAESAVRRIRAVARLRPFETSTPQGRSRERYRRALLTTMSSGFARIVNVLTILVTVPLTLHYLGSERYGLWMTMSSLIVFLSFSDLGINNGLLNGISRANGTGDRELARQYVSSAAFFLSAVALAIGICFVAAYPWISWKALFHINSQQALAEAGPAVKAFVICFLLNIPIGIVGRVQLGYQQGFATYAWTTVGSILSLTAILVVIHLHGSLMWLILAMAGSPLLVQSLNGAFLFGIQRRWLLPRWSYVNAEVSKDLLHSGFSFFILQLATAVAFSSDNIVLAQVLGPEAVTQYSVPSRLFSLVATVSVVLLGPLWPAYGEALVRRDHEWIRRTLLRSMFLAIGVSLVMGTVFAIFGTRIIRVWVGNGIHPSQVLLIGLAIWCVLNALSNSLTAFLGGASLLSFAVKVAICSALANITLSVYLTRKIGISGVVYGSIVAQTFFAIVPYFIYLRRYFSTTGPGGVQALRDPAAPSADLH